ncbi:Hint domain-containing protein [Roseovarius rhodophyticola]|uniref:Hint domain-containing protein n=1 Tax=Roseovarius rhodophyticola TaxID=3080827 RepID=A0ABZ2TD71_9RHOB|nr:Hint domain-containing protein [Roseovarius sp. W115]
MSVHQDSANLFEAKITLVGGGAITLNVNIRQMENGDVFMTSGTGLDNLDIAGIELLSVVETNFSGTGIGQSVDNTTVCFAKGTLIATPSGAKRVEALREGDLVKTAKGSQSKILWVGHSVLLRPGERQAPICIEPDALGPGLPKNHLLVSPQHRIVASSRIVQLMFDCDQVLVAARHLLALPGVTRQTGIDAVHYVHVLCARHEIILAEGVPTETLFLGPMAKRMLTKEQFEHVCQFAIEPMAPARPFADGKRAKKLIDRHRKNRKWLQSELCGAATA